MDLSILKDKIQHLPVSPAGRRSYPAEIRAEVVRAARASSLSHKEFCEQVGIIPSALYSMLRGSGRARRVPTFRRASIINESKGFRVLGPGGLQVVCSSASEVAELWRALC